MVEYYFKSYTPMDVLIIKRLYLVELSPLSNYYIGGSTESSIKLLHWWQHLHNNLIVIEYIMGVLIGGCALDG